MIQNRWFNHRIFQKNKHYSNLLGKNGDIKNSRLTVKFISKNHKNTYSAQIPFYHSVVIKKKKKKIPTARHTPCMCTFTRIRVRTTIKINRHRPQPIVPVNRILSLSPVSPPKNRHTPRGILYLRLYDDNNIMCISMFVFSRVPSLFSSGRCCCCCCCFIR